MEMFLVVQLILLSLQNNQKLILLQNSNKKTTQVKGPISQFNQFNGHPNDYLITSGR